MDGRSLRVVGLDEDERDGTPFGFERCAVSGVVRFNACFDVACLAYLEGLVVAAENVDVVHGVPIGGGDGTAKEYALRRAPFGRLLRAPFDSRWMGCHERAP